MLNERLNATRPIAKSLKGAETAMIESLRMIGTLLVDIADAKASKGTRFELSAGVAAGEKIAMAGVSTMQGYKYMIDAHSELAQDRDAAGLGAVSYGDSCPLLPEGKQQTMLKVVGE